MNPERSMSKGYPMVVTSCLPTRANGSETALYIILYHIFMIQSTLFCIFQKQNLEISL